MHLIRLLPVLIPFVTVSLFAQNVKFSMPLKGINGKDFFICRYVDHDASSDISDAYCGTMTYDGHKGTDFLIRGFKTMDSGVYVYAVADGRVFEVKDGNDDRMKSLDISAKPNIIGIIHKDRLCTYYLHLMNHSLLVKPGDSVKSGQPIAKVGSSGYSTSPHLHLQVEDSNRHIIDPFAGGCPPNDTTMWLVQPTYDTSLFLLEDGFIPYIPNLDALQERYLVNDTFYANQDTTVCYWVLCHGLKKGSKLTWEWISQDGISWASNSFIWKMNEAYAHFWSYIKVPKSRGKWAANLFINGKLMATRNFYVKRSKRR